jgi:enoyl-CoA hydratase/carnithine racemase
MIQTALENQAEENMGNQLISREIKDGVVVLRLNHSVTNVINRDLVLELMSILSAMDTDDAVLGLVITSANDKFFSIGFDIPDLFDKSKSEFRDFYAAFSNLCAALRSLSG